MLAFLALTVSLSCRRVCANRACEPDHGPDMRGRNARTVMRRPATAMDVRSYFESDATGVSSPLTVFGRLTSYGRDFLPRFAPHVRGRRVLDAGAGLGVVSVELAHHYGAFVV